MNISIIEDRCCGHARCQALCPEVFGSDEFAHVALNLSAIPPALQSAARAAAQACPEGAILLGEAAGPSTTAEQGFEVELASSKAVFWIPTGASITTVLRAHGVEIETSCEQGVCGTCLTMVLAGEPEHNDMFLSPSEQAANDQCLLCCAGSRSARLVLDL